MLQLLKPLQYFRLLLLSGVLFACATTFAQKEENVFFPAEKLLQDLDTLYKTILQSHPKPGGFLDLDSFHHVYDSLSSTITDSLSDIEFSIKVAELIGSMGDSHTSLDYTQFVQWSFKKNKYVVPFSAFSEQGKIYLHHDWEDKIPGGSEIVSVNGIAVRDIWNTALIFSCREGDSPDAQLRIADAILPSLTSLLANADSINSFQVISSITGELDMHLLPGLNEKVYKTRKKERLKLPQNKVLDFQINDSSTVATLRIGTFAPANIKAYQKFIRKSFREIHRTGCDSLILDLRGNGGGSSNQVEYLYSFLDTSGYNTPANVISVKSPLALKRVRPMTKKVSLFVLRNFFKKNEDIQGFLKMVDLPMGALDTSYFKVRRKQAEKDVFMGSCVLLINGLTASAGVDFTNAFQLRNRGLIVGEPCLGPTSGTWGNPAYFVLPNSRVKLTISTIRYNYDNSFRYEKAALQPDIRILPSCTMALEKKDECLEYLKNGWNDR